MDFFLHRYSSRKSIIYPLCFLSSSFSLSSPVIKRFSSVNGRRLELYFRGYQVTRPRKPSFERKRYSVKDLLAKRFPACASHAIHAFALVTHREIGCTLPHSSFFLLLFFVFFRAHDFWFQKKRKIISWKLSMIFLLLQEKRKKENLNN